MRGGEGLRNLRPLAACDEGRQAVDWSGEVWVAPKWGRSYDKRSAWSYVPPICDATEESGSRDSVHNLASIATTAERLRTELAGLLNRNPDEVNLPRYVTARRG